MHLYRIDIYNLNADGSVGTIHASEYADAPEKVLSIMDRWEGIKLHDEEGNATANPAYKAIIKVAKYQDINIAQFRAMYR